MRKRWQTR